MIAIDFYASNVLHLFFLSNTKSFQRIILLHTKKENCLKSQEDVYSVDLSNTPKEVLSIV